MRRVLIGVGVVTILLTATPALAGSGPTAVDDKAETGSETIHIYVLDNDIDPDYDLDPTSLTLVREPSKGKAVVISVGRTRVKYTPSSGETGADHFSYQVCDVTGLCSAATVTITITTPVTTTTTTTTSTTVSTSADTQDTTTDQASPPPTTTSTLTSTSTTTTTTEMKTDVAGQAVLSSPTIDTALLGEGHGVGLAATMAMIFDAGAETVRIAAVPAVMGAGLAGFLASGLPKDVGAALLGWIVGRRKRNEEPDG